MSDALSPVRVLHTSDWHLGCTLFGRRRYEEAAAFLDWLAGVMEQEAVDVLLVAGDVFDTGTPSNRAQELYYAFLCRVARSGTRHIVITSGNHDSPSFLNAPRELLKALHIHVVSTTTDRPEDEVLVLRDLHDAPELIVCAVPYLRDTDVRQIQEGEGSLEKETRLRAGIRDHYARVTAYALEERKRIAQECEGREIPLITMGHLYTQGGQLGEGVRNLYVGTLAGITPEIFPDGTDYVALGHLHVPQTVQGKEFIRYAGSPLPMGFNEAGQQKSVCLIDCAGRRLAVRELPVPVFRKLAQVRGDEAALDQALRALAAQDEVILLEVIYEGEDPLLDLSAFVDARIMGSRLEVLKLSHPGLLEASLEQSSPDETLGDLDVEDVFLRLLDQKDIPEEARPELVRTYSEAVRMIHDRDANRE